MCLCSLKNWFRVRAPHLLFVNVTMSHSPFATQSSHTFFSRRLVVWQLQDLRDALRHLLLAGLLQLLPQPLYLRLHVARIQASLQEDTVSRGPRSTLTQPRHLPLRHLEERRWNWAESCQPWYRGSSGNHYASS